MWKDIVIGLLTGVIVFYAMIFSASGQTVSFDTGCSAALLTGTLVGGVCWWLSRRANREFFSSHGTDEDLSRELN